MSLILGKRVPFSENVSSLEKKGLFLVIYTGKGLFSSTLCQRFGKKGVLFPSVNISERSNFLI